jgi:tetratricopeptide (TPR) repeat protein
MQRLIDTLRESLNEFIAQPDYPTLVLDGTDSALVLPTRILAALDRQDEANYYLLFPQPCADGSAYVGAIIDSLRQQLEVFNAELAARGRPLLAPMPLEVTDGRQPPNRRLEAVIRYMGGTLPGDSPIVWGFLPAPLTDVSGYEAAIRALLLPAPAPPWMDRHRFIVRDQQSAPAIVAALFEQKNDRVLVLDVELDNASVMDGLVRTAQDPALPPDERMLAFFQLAAVDFSFQRYPEALEKYGAMFNYYASTGNKPMQALCLSGAGDTLRQQGRAEEALIRYQESIGIAGEDQNVPALQAGSQGAGTCCLALGSYAEAEGYLTLSNTLAGKLNNPFAKCDAMEKLGVARFRQDKFPEAVDIWLKGKNLAKQFGYAERAKAIVEHLLAACDQAGLHSERLGFERELRELGGAAAASPQPDAELAAP